MVGTLPFLVIRVHFWSQQSNASDFAAFERPLFGMSPLSVESKVHINRLALEKKKGRFSGAHMVLSDCL
jgi:hypothetical protein